MQLVNDTTYFPNKQIAYVKENDSIIYYSSKGDVLKTMNLKTRIEKNNTFYKELVEFSLHSKSVFNMGAGYYCYPDAIVTPKGTKVNNLILDSDKVEHFPKNNFGYPKDIAYNKYGLLLGNTFEKRTYNDLGLLLSVTQLTSDKVPYKTINCVYDDSHLVESIHEGKAHEDNYMQHYEFNTKGQFKQMVRKKDEHPIEVQQFVYDENDRIKLKKVFTNTGDLVIAKTVKYAYNDNHLIEIKTLKTQPHYVLETVNKATFLNDVIAGKFNDFAIKDTFPTKVTIKSFIYENDNLIVVKEKDITSGKDILKNEQEYIYNDLNQLIEVIFPKDVSKLIFQYND